MERVRPPAKSHEWRMLSERYLIQPHEKHKKVCACMFALECLDVCMCQRNAYACMLNKWRATYPAQSQRNNIVEVFGRRPCRRRTGRRATRRPSPSHHHPATITSHTPVHQPQARCKMHDAHGTLNDARCTHSRCMIVKHVWTHQE